MKGEARLIGIGPQEFVDDAERAAHQEPVLQDPALDELILEQVAIVGDHG